MSHREDTLKELSSLRDFFTTAQSQLRSGNVVDMTGMDSRIASVCEAVKEAPPKQQQVFLPELSVLIELLGNYEMELRNLQAALAQKAENTKGSNDNS